jgi:hypothetical protein
MPATLGGQLTLGSIVISLLAVLLVVARRMTQYIELLTKTILWYARSTGQEVPNWLAEQYKRVNGHAKDPRELTASVLGEQHVIKEPE